jgi:hypothetical protein
MTKNPDRRLGSSDENDIKRHRFFASMDWPKLENRAVKPSFIPTIRSPMDCENFDPEFTNAPAELTPMANARLTRQQQNEFRDFSFVNDEFGEHLEYV